VVGRTGPKYLTGRRRLKGGFKGSPHKIKDYFLTPKGINRIRSLACFYIRRGLGGPGPPKIAIYSLKERKSGFYSLHLYLLMRALVAIQETQRQLILM
jgi:hypothetical protein